MTRAELNDLTSAKLNHQYVIREIKTDEKEVKEFLFTLGCFEGEHISKISVLADNYIVNLKDARYSIDSELAKAIIV